jgi:hypothetical protein
VALWLVDHQMNLRVSEEFGLYYARIPLRNSPHIRHANALRLDWNEVLPAERCGFVMGNPPFIGAKFMDDAQREDSRQVFQGIDNAGLLDFVAAWYVKATRYVKSETNCRCAFVSTNSITQGEQVGVLWGWMHGQGIRIQFAHRTFNWSNEGRGNAAVHCVILGFGLQDLSNKTIYEYEDIKGTPLAVPAKNINPYLVDASDIVLPRRSKPICTVPDIRFGNQPIDGGNFILTSQDATQLKTDHPEMTPFIRTYIGAEEFINGGERFCLWLTGCPPKLLREIPFLRSRLDAVRKFRLESSRAATRDLAATPTEFAFISHTGGSYLVVPSVSSERRTYVPIGFDSGETIVSNLCLAIYDAGLFHFGVMTSAMHNAFMRFTCGRLKSDFRYSNTIVYNNFPWPGFAGEPLSDKHKSAIAQTAQAVLDARAAFPTSSLADLYDPLTMPPALLKAHQKLDTAVDAAYQPSGGKKSYASDAERVAFLFELYQRITSLLPMTALKKARKSRVADAPRLTSTHH